MKKNSLNADFLSAKELEKFGVHDAKKRRILVHSKAVIVDFNAINFGENIRIDPFVVISCASLTIGSNVHIAVGCGIIGSESITLNDYSTLSGHVLVYSSSDDYSGYTMTNPTIPNRFKNVENAKVEIGRHCIVGARSVILPGSWIGEGAAVGSGSLVKGTLPNWTISAGVPARVLKLREKGCLQKEVVFKNTKNKKANDAVIKVN